MRNSLVRDNFIKQYGKEKFDKMCETNKRFSKYREPPIPKQYKWIFNQFMFIWGNAEMDFNGNRIFTFQTLNEYEKCMKVYFTIVEKKLLFKMNQWVQETISDFSK